MMKNKDKGMEKEKTRKDKKKRKPKKKAKKNEHKEKVEEKNSTEGEKEKQDVVAPKGEEDKTQKEKDDGEKVILVVGPSEALFPYLVSWAASVSAPAPTSLRDLPNYGKVPL